MSDLVKFNQENLPAISPKLVEVMEVLDTQLVSKVLPGDIFNQVKIGAKKAFIDTGFPSPAGPDLEYLLMEIMRHVQRVHPALRIGEIPVAINRGARKEYGEYYGLSVISFCMFIDSYVKHEDRKNALLERAKLATKTADQPDYHQIFDMAKGNALRALNDVADKRDITLYGSIVFDWLVKIQVIDAEIFNTEDFAEQARSELYREFEMKAEMTLDKYKRREFGDIVKSLIPKEDGSVDNLVAHKILNRAKCLTLKAFMEGVLLDELPLKQMIEERRSRDNNTDGISPVNSIKIIPG